MSEASTTGQTGPGTQNAPTVHSKPISAPADPGSRSGSGQISRPLRPAAKTPK